MARTRCFTQVFETSALERRIRAPMYVPKN